MQRLLEKKLKRPEVSEELITLDSLEEKLVNFAVNLSHVQDNGLRKLLEFLYDYIVDKPNTTPQNRTIAKHFELDPENETIRDDIRRVLYAVRLIKEISTDKQRIEKIYRF